MTDSRESFEEWAKTIGWRDFNRVAFVDSTLYFQPDLQKLWEGWSARDSEVERLREALRVSTYMLQECCDELGAGPMSGIARQIVKNNAALSHQAKEPK